MICHYVVHWLLKYRRHSRVSETISTKQTRDQDHHWWKSKNTEGGTSFSQKLSSWLQHGQQQEHSKPVRTQNLQALHKARENSSTAMLLVEAVWMDHKNQSSSVSLPMCTSNQARWSFKIRQSWNLVCLPDTLKYDQSHEHSYPRPRW